MISKIKVLFVLFSFLMVAPYVAQSQDDQYQYFDAEEDSINVLFTNIVNSNNDKEKLEINSSIKEMIEYLLYDNRSFDHTFDSISNLGVLKSADELLKIYNWNIIFSDGSYKYYGFIQYLDVKSEEYLIYELVDKSDSIQKPEKYILSNENWYGALYYQIIENEGPRYKFYTLLGWDGNNEWSKKKIIDVLYFNSSLKPRFGSNIFSTIKQGDKRKRAVRQKRIIFEYNSKVNMTLTYNSKMKMIVFDHLSLDDSSSSDDMRYYGPDWSYCGLKFKKGKWHYYDDIDPRNPKPKEKSAKWEYKKSEDIFGL